MTSPFPGAPRRNNTPVLAVVVGLVLVVVAGAVFGGYMLAHGDTPPGAASNPGPVRLHVTDLMAKANCVGAKSETQLYSYETGECTLAGARVIIAVFDTGELRDRWLTTARQFMDTLVAGVDWAAAMSKPNAAPLLLDALGGAVVL